MTTKQREPFEAYGVECGKGWAKLYQPLLDLAGLYGSTVFQVKEKFGGLRFYHGTPAEHVTKMNAMVRCAESASFHTCEECGEDQADWVKDGEEGKLVYRAQTKGSGWIRTLCDPCRKTWEEQRDTR